MAKLAETQTELASTEGARDDLSRQCEEITIKANDDIQCLQATHKAEVAHLIKSSKHKLTLTTSALGVLVTQLSNDFAVCAQQRDEEAAAHQKYLAGYNTTCHELSDLRDAYEHDTAQLRQAASNAETKYKEETTRYKNDLSHSLEEKESLLAISNEKVMPAAA